MHTSDEVRFAAVNFESLMTAAGSKAPVQHYRKPTLPSVVYQDLATVSKGRTTVTEDDTNDSLLLVQGSLAWRA